MAYPSKPLPPDWQDQIMHKTIAQCARDFTAQGYPIHQVSLGNRIRRYGIPHKIEQARKIPRDYHKIMPRLTIAQGAEKWGIDQRKLRAKCNRDFVEYIRAARGPKPKGQLDHAR